VSPASEQLELAGTATASDPSEGRPPPAAEQRRAIEARYRDVFLRAGAGTGKTTVLVDRFCAAVLEDDVPVDGVLAFTFTERAADQLRRRIRRELLIRSQTAGARGDAELARELLSIARATEAAWISTIHGFCKRLLTAHPVAAGIDPRFRVIDEPEADRLAGRAFERALEELLAAGEPAAERLASSAQPWMLREMIRSAHDELRSRGEEHPALPELERPNRPASLAALGNAARAALEATDGGRRTSNHERIERAIGLAELARGGALPAHDELDDLTVKSGAAIWACAEIETYNRAVAAARAAAATDELGWAYEPIRSLLRIFCRRYRELKAERSGLDFEDLQLRTVALLGEHPSIRESMRVRFKHILVDEFQDTNLLQLELLEQLQGPDARRFCVGDEFQSIYGFRHADLAVYRAEAGRFEDEPGAEVMRLAGNFRSNPPVLAAVNALGAALLGPRFEPLKVGAAPSGPPPNPATELLLVGEDGWDEEETELRRPEDDPSPASRVAEAQFLAKRLQELADENVPPGDMVVLLRARTHVGAYERALTDAGLSPYVVGGRGYWSSQQVDDALSLLRCVANPLDDQALLGALAGPAGAVLPGTLWLLRRAAGERRHLWPTLARLEADEERTDEQKAAIEAIGPEQRRRLGEFRKRLDQLRDEAAELPLATLVERTCSAFGYDIAVLMLDRGARRWANVRKLQRMASEFEASEGRDLPGFLAWCDSHGADELEGEAAIAAEAHDGVLVMTVHAAKGLEFPVVAVADLGRDLLQGGFPPQIRIGRDGGATQVGLMLARLGKPSARMLDYDELAERAQAGESEEALRLAYVAATRAESRLILSGTFKAKQPREINVRTPVSERLLERFAAQFEGVRDPDGPARFSIEVPAASAREGLDEEFEPGRIEVRVMRAHPGAGRELRPPQESSGEPEKPEPVAPPLLPVVDRAGPEAASRVSYASLSEYDRCAYRFYVERVLGIRPRETPTALQPYESRDDTKDEFESRAAERGALGFGSAVHRLLEWSVRHRFSAPPEPVARAALASEGVTPEPETIDRATAMVQGWLDSVLCRELATSRRRARPEARFAIPLAGALVRGSIDLLTETDAGEPLVVDYKTDRLEESDPQQRMSHYGVQRDVYALAASGDGVRPVTTAYVFLERPDDPILERDEPGKLESARDRLTSLIEGIRSGDFPVTDTPHIGICRECPARERLCSHPLELTGRSLPG
jgi:ATP-dependent exoDNAse (exonuclease V) beta subunit